MLFFLGVKEKFLEHSEKDKCFSSWELKSNDLLRKSKYDKAAYDDGIETEAIDFSLTYELNKHIKNKGYYDNK